MGVRYVRGPGLILNRGSRESLTEKMTFVQRPKAVRELVFWTEGPGEAVAALPWG